LSITTIQSTEEVSYVISQKIKTHLDDNKNILWLISGGSAIKVAIGTLKMLANKTTTKNLHVGLIDERYGDIGHTESNWQQLKNSGIDKYRIQRYPILESLSIKETAQKYCNTVHNLITNTDVAIGLLGLGEDGHTAGLLPNNPIMKSRKLYDYYTDNQFERISATPLLLNELNHLDVYIFGKNKLPALKNIFKPGIVDKVPGRILNDFKSIEIFTNNKGVEQ